MNILFMSNWEKTTLFAPVARILRERGFGIFWIATSPYYVDYLVEQGFPRDTVLHLRRDEARRVLESEVDHRLISDLERVSGDTLRHVAGMDRIVKHWSSDEIHRYGAYICRNVFDFIERHDLKVAFGEPSTYHELLTDMVLRAMGRTYIAPFSLRLPVPRFLNWIGRDESRFLTTGPETQDDVTDEQMALAREVIQNVAVKRVRPAYWYMNKRAPRVSGTFLKKIAGGVRKATVDSKIDGNMYSLDNILRHQRLHMRPFFYYSAKLRWSSIFEHAVEDEKFVLYTLPKQPEYTVDVLAARYSNQLETIKAMARSLPANTRLYVKEHSASLGDRSVKQLMDLKRVPGVRLIDPMEDTHELITNSVATVTPAGTASLEAAFHGKRTYTLASSFINNFSTCRTLSTPWELGEAITEPVRHDPEADVRYLAWLLANAPEGEILFSAPSENHEKVATGMQRALERHFAERQLVSV